MTVAPVERSLDLGDDSIGINITMTIDVDGTALAITSDFSLVAVGRATSSVSLFGFDAARDVEVDRIITRAAEKTAEQFSDGG